ncbi:MAG: hypothetical protein LC808_02310 [Actinobacteria bacterium]|nr:hypothetical protein [Actinomycetota bacterium]
MGPSPSVIPSCLTSAAWCRKELAHVLLHDGSEYATGCRGRAEVEAESVAFVVLSTAGVDAGTYSFA